MTAWQELSIWGCAIGHVGRRKRESPKCRFARDIHVLQPFGKSVNSHEIGRDVEKVHDINTFFCAHRRRKEPHHGENAENAANPPVLHRWPEIHICHLREWWRSGSGQCFCPGLRREVADHHPGRERHWRCRRGRTRRGQPVRASDTVRRAPLVTNLASIPGSS